MKRLFLTDAMNLAYRIAYVPSFSDLRTSTGRPTGILHGFLTSMMSETGRDDCIIVVWDSRSERKRKAFSGYKAGRDNKDAIGQALVNDVQTQLPTLRRILSLMGILQYHVMGYEADEVIGQLAINSSLPVTIMSEDKDFLQLVSKRIHILQPIRNRLITEENFGRYYMGLTPEDYFQFRLFTGDESDEIPGIPGCGEKTALEIVRNNGKTQGKLEIKLRKKIDKDSIFDIVQRNFHLMSLAYESVTRIAMDEGRIIPCENSQRLYNMLMALELKQVAEIWKRRTGNARR